MAHKRKEFTDNQKAEIFVRDTATCGFSGISLWFLDNGIKSNWQVDWVDHIKPSASGGGAEIENGICASNLFNAKKKDNSNDNVYFVKNGNLTEQYLTTFGKAPDSLIERLIRLKNLKTEDWFFNRCISGIFIGFDCRCDKEFKGIDYKRTDAYWFSSGWKKLQKYHKKKGQESLYQRGLVKTPIPFGTKELLKLENTKTEDDFAEWIEDNYSSYRESYKALFEYFNTVKIEDRQQYICKLENKTSLHPEIITSLKAHNTIYNK
jgi:hypothetical protein